MKEECAVFIIMNKGLTLGRQPIRTMCRHADLIFELPAHKIWEDFLPW